MWSNRIMVAGLVGLLLLVITNLSTAYVRSTTDSGVPLFWADPSPTFTLALGCPSNRHTIEAWGPCWDDVARHAAEEWNQAGADFQFQFQEGEGALAVSCAGSDFHNGVTWEPSLCGKAWGSTVAYTKWWFYEDGSFADTDISFDANRQWAVYSGSIRRSGSRTTYDLHRVALHEFGHALGLNHPDEHGQRVQTIMHSQVGGRSIDTLQPDDIAGVRAIYGAAAPKGVLENPGHQTFQSGIGVISGWACTASRVEVMIGQTRYRAAYGTERPDTRSVCGDTNNGFAILFNYNSLRDGIHTARFLVDGRQLGHAAEFKVTTFGQEFLRGVEADYWLLDFPSAGRDALVVWSQAAQNFTIAERR